MPIQSTPVTTQSSINLSDINIDTDLDMGSNSIIGYTPTSNIMDNIKLLSNNTDELQIFNPTTIISYSDDTEYNTTSVSTTPVVLSSFTILKNGYIYAKLQATLKSSSSYPSYIKVYKNSSATTPSIEISHNNSTYTAKELTYTTAYQVTVGDIISVVAYSGNATSSAYRKLVKAEIIQISEINNLKSGITFSF